MAREDNESGNDDRQGESSETSTHDDDDGDSYHRQVKEFQRRAISRFPVRCRTISDAH